MSTKKSSDTTRNQTHDLSACSAVPQYFVRATSNLQQNKKPWHHYYFMEKAYTKITLMGNN